VSSPISFDLPVNRLVAAMATARSWPQLILSSAGAHVGKPYAFSGADPQHAIGTTERYDPATNTWAAGPNLHTAVFAGLAILLTDGETILLAGGIASTYSTGLTSSQVYSDAGNVWGSSQGAMNNARADFPGTLSGAHVFVSGGYGALSNNLPVVTATSELYDPIADAWASKASMARARGGHQLTTLVNGKILATGGYTQLGRSFSQAPRVPGGWSGSGFATTSCELYDPGADTWTAVASMHHPRFGHKSVLLPDGRVFVAGGYTSGNEQDGATALCEVYDPVRNEWSVIAPMPAGQGYAATALLWQTHIWVFTGGGFAGTVPVAAAFDMDALRWTDIGPIDPLGGAGAAASGSMDALAVGSSNASNIFIGIPIYTPGHDTPAVTYGTPINFAGLYDSNRLPVEPWPAVAPLYGWSAGGTGQTVDCALMNGAVRVVSVPDLATFDGTIDFDGSGDGSTWIPLLSFTGTTGPLEQPYAGSFRYLRARCTVYNTGVTSAEIDGQTDG